MRKFLFALAATVLAGGQCAIAAESPYQGSDVGVEGFEGGTYYLYNVSTGSWLQENNHNPAYWLTHAEIGNVGLDFGLIVTDEALKFQIDPKFGNNHSLVIDGLWMDTNRPITIWTATPVEGADGYVYTLTSVNGDKQYTLGIGEDGNISDVATDGTEWQFVSAEERLAVLKAEADAENPVNATWLVPAATFNHPVNERVSAWEKSRNDCCGFGGNNGDIKYNFVFEAWALGNFTIQQTAEVPNGNYRISAQGFYSQVDAAAIGAQGESLYNQYIEGTLANCATFFAGDKTAEIPSIFAEAQDEAVATEFGLALGNGKYIPQNIWQFSKAVMDGYYKIAEPLEVKVTDGKLNLGAKVVDAPGAAWFAIDQISIEYLGDESTGVEENVAAPAVKGDGKIYNIMGVEVKSMDQHGIYIVNGQKILK